MSIVHVWEPVWSAEEDWFLVDRDGLFEVYSTALTVGVVIAATIATAGTSSSVSAATAASVTALSATSVPAHRCTARVLRNDT